MKKPQLLMSGAIPSFWSFEMPQIFNRVERFVMIIRRKSLFEMRNFVTIEKSKKVRNTKWEV